MITPSDVYEINDFVQNGQIDRAPTAERIAPHARENVLRFWTVCPWSDTLTQYDFENVYLFARLLDADSEGADIDEIAHVVFRIADPRHKDRARRIVASHLARARWLLDNGFPFLNW